MTSLEEISVELRDGGHTEPGSGVQKSLSRGEQNLQDPGGFGDAGGNPVLTQGRMGETNDGVLDEQPVDSGPKGIRRPTHEDYRARFYEQYRDGAEEYDKDLVKKYNEDMNVTLIFAGFFSIVTSAFIIQIQSQLLPDLNQEATALLRILVYNADKTAFGGNVPTLPQWNGPPKTITHVLCLLYTSLAVSLLAAFLAMLGKQWLNRYAAVDMRVSAVERSQNRQRKLDGTVAWYFRHVLDSLPLMLQAGLLLQGYALSRYLWEIDITVASVVIGVTSFGVLFYFVIVIAGSISESCPYQTPGSFVLRQIPGLFRPAYTLFVKHSEMYSSSVAWWAGVSRLPALRIVGNTLAYPFVLLFAFAIDVINIGRATFRSLVNLTHRTPNRPHFTPDQVDGDQVTKQDFRCSFWMLQTPSGKAVKVSTLNFLGTILSLAGLNSTVNSAVITDCFNIFSSCFVLRDGAVAMVVRGSEDLAGISAMCFLRAFTSLSVTEPTSTIIRDVRQRYPRVFPSRIDLLDLPRPIVVSAVHHLLAGPRDRTEINWRGYHPTVEELIPFSRALAQAAQLERRRGGDQPKVPRWLIRFALRFLSQNPLPPTSVVIDCLTIIATDLGCTLPDANRTGSGERARLENLFTSIVQGYETIASSDQHIPESKGKATIALLPYASRREEDGAALPISLKYAFLDAFRHSHSFLEHSSNVNSMLQRWIAAASTLPYTDDVCEGVVDTLLRMSFQDELRQHIPAEAWDWLKKRPVLGPNCQGLKYGASLDAFQTVRKTGNLELITSYLFVVWSKWSWSYPDGCTAVLEFIRSGLRGVEGMGYRADLIKRLNAVLSQMDSDPSPPPEAADNASWYAQFRTALEEGNKGARR